MSEYLQEVKANNSKNNGLECQPSSTRPVDVVGVSGKVSTPLSGVLQSGGVESRHADLASDGKCLLGEAADHGTNKNGGSALAGRQAADRQLAIGAGVAPGPLCKASTKRQKNITENITASSRRVLR